MALCTVAEVASEFKAITFTSSTTVTDTEVTRFITEAEEEINSRLNRRYVVPVTEAGSPLSFILLRQICIWLVADRVREIMEMKMVPTPDLRQEMKALDAGKRARAQLVEIVAGKMILRDVELATTHDGVKSFAVDEGLENHFKKGTAPGDLQW